MAHKIINIPEKVRKFKMPNMGGEFGLTLSFGKKQVFLGVLVRDVIEEKLIKRKVLAVQGNSRTFQVDPLETQEGNTEG